MKQATPHEGIINIIEDSTHGFYVSVGGFASDVIVTTHSGHKKLKTKPDTIGKDNLLDLPECP